MWELSVWSLLVCSAGAGGCSQRCAGHDQGAQALTRQREVLAWPWGATSHFPALLSLRGMLLSSSLVLLLTACLITHIAWDPSSLQSCLCPGFVQSCCCTSIGCFICSGFVLLFSCIFTDEVKFLPLLC